MAIASITLAAVVILAVIAFATAEPAFVTAFTATVPASVGKGIVVVEEWRAAQERRSGSQKETQRQRNGKTQIPVFHATIPPARTRLAEFMRFSRFGTEKPT